MKRMMLVLLALWMLCSCAWAGAPESEWAVVNNPDPEDRLNLRAEPSRASSSLGKYFNGVMVEVLERTGDGWDHVRVGATEGYMMMEYLADPAKMIVVVEPVLPVATVNNPFADAQGLLEKPDSADVTLMVTLYNGTEVTVLGLTEQRAHVQYCGVTGYIPLQSLSMEEKQGANSIMDLPQMPDRQIVRATLIRGEEVTSLTDSQKLRMLQDILTHTEYWGYRMAGCPIGATLTLEFDQASVQVMELATDSCPVYRLDGHDYYYARHIGTPGNHPDNSVLYSLFDSTAP